MVKLLGMISVLTASVIMGFVMANELGERAKALKEIHEAAIHIKTELEYRAADICDCFNRRGKLFSLAYKYITEEGLLPADALNKAICDTPFLTDDDQDVIKAYADNLNKEDIGGQIANTSLLIENLRLKIKEAEDEYRSKSRLYKSGGAIAGLGFIILLL